MICTNSHINLTPLTTLDFAYVNPVILTGLEIGRVLRAWPFSPKFKLGASGHSVFCVDLRPPFHTDDLLLGLPDDSYPQGTACMYMQHNIYHSTCTLCACMYK